jgi:hypothetical protein
MIGRRTIKAKTHLGFEHLELVRHARLGLGAHLLASPLEGTVNLLRDTHIEGGLGATLVELLPGKRLRRVMWAELPGGGRVCCKGGRVAGIPRRESRDFVEEVVNS